MASWRNWSGSVTAAPQSIAAPRTVAELQTLVAGAGRVRAAGAGHSFMPLCETDGLLLDLSQMEGELEILEDGHGVWAPAGWPIHRLTAALWEAGFSLANQGDIDKQAIAGALATGTHGTGATLGSISTQAAGFSLILADGSRVVCDAAREPDLFEAQRVSLGALGIMERVKLNVLPAYRLKETLRPAPLEEVLADWDRLVAAHRHVEFFVFPYADTALLKTLDPVESGEDPPPSTWLESAALQFASDLTAAVPALAAPVQRLLTRAMSASSRAAPAHRIFPSERDTRFEEMEWELPAAQGPDALRAAMAQVRSRGDPIIFPFEFRVVAADDIWLSPMTGRACVSISFHQYARMPWRNAFAAMETLFRGFGGRPHWAKRHRLSSLDVLALYPKAPDWGAVRRRVDPEAKFLNDHLRALFEFSL